MTTSPIKGHADLAADLHARWLPSKGQMNQADALLATGGFPDGVYTTHLLHGKTFGFWTADVEVEPLDGLFATRQSALYYVHDAAKREHERTHEDVVGGYAWHPRIGEAAVWEDICSEFSLNK